jgi:RNA-directed DNA polymerase
VRRIRERLTAEMRALRGANADAVLQRLNPIIRGWSAYYRSVVSSEAFHALDAHMWRLAYKWARFRHPNKSKRWVTARYFGVFNTSRRDRWVFGDRESGAYLTKFAWTKIVRHAMVAGNASPDDPALIQYWAARRRRQPNGPLNVLLLAQLKAQRGRCALCGTLLLHADREPQSPTQWERWLRGTRIAIRKHNIAPDNGEDDQRLIHTACRSRTTGTAAPALLTATPVRPA